MRSRITTGTLVFVVAAAPILVLAVLAGTSPGTESPTPQQPAAGINEPVQVAAVATATTAAPQPPGQRRVFGSGGTVTLYLERTDPYGQEVAPGTQIVWQIRAEVSTGDNLGLALISVDLVQDANNPELFDIPTADRPMGAGGMDKFDRPLGISYPDGAGSAYGGTQIGVPGAMNLVQIGGAQNIFGETFSGVLKDATIEPDVGQEQDGRVIATGSFPAPFTTGTYKFDLSDGVANTLMDVNTPPAYSRVSAATVDIVTEGSFSFTVQ